MGMLMVRCPKTGRAIATGRYIESRLFSSTPVFFGSTYCPHCRVRHEWFVKDVGFVILTRLNVNSWVRRRRAARLFEMVPQTAQQP
jgi:hypothetical protein